MRSLLVQKFYMRAGSCVQPSSLFHIPRVLFPHLLLLSSDPLWSVTRASGLLAPLTPFLEQPSSACGGKTQRLTFILPEPTSQTLLFPSLTALWTMGRSFHYHQDPRDAILPAGHTPSPQAPLERWAWPVLPFSCFPCTSSLPKAIKVGSMTNGHSLS